MTFIIVGAFVVAAIVAVALLSKKKKQPEVSNPVEVAQVLAEAVEVPKDEVVEEVKTVEAIVEAKPKKAPAVKKATVKKAVKSAK